MEKSLRKSYDYLNLPFTATEEDVKTRETVMIKILQAKGNKRNNNQEEKINRVKSSANLIIENLRLNGIPNVKPRWFETSKESLIIQLIVLVFVGIICYVSFIAIL